MALVERFGVSMDVELLAAFDGYLRRRGFANRSEAIRDLVRSELGRGRLTENPEAPVVGVVALELRADEMDAGTRLREELTAAADLVFATLHLPTGSEAELVVVSVRGQEGQVRSAADRWGALRGVRLLGLTVLPAEGVVREPAPEEAEGVR
jgi:CopG family nickel-responsive transcriptional regulator